MNKLLRNALFVLTLFLLTAQSTKAQFLMDMVDTTNDIGKGLLDIYKNYNHIHVGGYLQPQYQVAASPGVKGFSGGDFSAFSNSRFMLRRGRIRFDYVRYAKNNIPSLQFVYQFDGTERGVFIRDFWGRVFDTKYQLFSFTGGMFARPFGYEVNLSSADRESPERGRMSQTLMKTERDIGAMVSFEPKKKDNPLHFFKLDAGYFNGQGLSATTDYDSYKDFIVRGYVKPCAISKNISLSGGISFFQGGLRQNTKYLNTISTNANNIKDYKLDSSEANIGQHLFRRYRGADMQLKIKEKVGATELRAEYWYGKQPGSSNSSEPPAVLLFLANDPYYLRNFNGAYFYLLQNIINKKNQIAIKLDWYDPNADVKKKEIGNPGTRFTPADIKYTTLGFGYLNYFNENLKLVLWYDRIWNETTQLAGYTQDIKDNIFTCRLQFRF